MKLFLLTLFTLSVAFKIILEPAETRCFGQMLDNTEIIVVDYKNSDPISSTTFFIRDPNNIVLHSNKNGTQESHRYTLTASSKGIYSFCFYNPSPKEKRDSHLYIISGSAAQNIVSGPSSSQLSGLERSVNQVQIATASLKLASNHKHTNMDTLQKKTALVHSEITRYIFKMIGCQLLVTTILIAGVYTKVCKKANSY